MNGRSGKFEVISSGGCHDCGGKCPYRVHVLNGKACRIEPYEELRPCARGYAYRKRVYASDRIRTPLRRDGKRGEGRFRPIGWDEALDLVATELRRVRERYGPAGIFCIASSGAPGRLHNAAVLFRLLNMFGGCVSRWGSASAEAAYFAALATYGVVPTGHTRDDLVFSKLAILVGWNPAETIQGPDTTYRLIEAKERGTAFVVVDPRFTNTAALLADEWIPVRPGTDTALLIAMAQAIVQKGLQDQGFLDRYTVGFEKYRDYLLGSEDGVVKSPAWAENITGVRSDIIEKLAVRYATCKPAALIPGFGPGRTAYGEQFHRAAAALAAITGNMGMHGGNPACCEVPQVGVTPGPNIPSDTLIPIGLNPLEAASPASAAERRLNPALRSKCAVNTSDLWDAFLQGRGGGFPSDVKMLYVVCGNPLNQYPNVNKAVEALKGLEFIVAHEQFITATARFADIVLPVSTHWERNDLMRPWLGGNYFFCTNKAISMQGDAKSDLQICTELASRLGIEGYSDKSEEQWLKEIVMSSPDTAEAVRDYDKFRTGGIHHFKVDAPVIAFQKEIENPEVSPFQTPSGRIEIYSQKLAELSNPEIPPIPRFIDPWEGPNDPLFASYPLQLITVHFKTRAHSCFDNILELKELQVHGLWINPSDATRRDIRDGDEVRVFNQRGEIRIGAYVTSRIMAGVVAVGEGAWYQPDQQGIDRGGCANVLTRDRSSPAGSLTPNTCLVEVAKPGQGAPTQGNGGRTGPKGKV